MKLIFIYCALLGAFNVFAQEGITPLLYNSELTHLKELKQKSSNETFDSTFIYTTDTLTLPIFDDFSSNKIQKYNSDFTAPGVTFDKKYRLTDLADVPLDASITYTTQATFRRIFNTENNEIEDVVFIPTSIKVGNLANYPVVYATTDVYPPYFIFDTIGAPDISDTVWIEGPNVYQDSATQFFTQMVDPNAIWLDDNAYHNYRYAVDPWSLGVMTFDGLDRTGFPYAIGTTLSGEADFLTSKVIDLSDFSIGDSIYFTFLVQRQGHGDIPEATDSLILEFYDSFEQEWTRYWGIGGGAVGEFVLAQVPLNIPNYLTDDFQFRFKNKGALSGSLDHFHLDYLKFRAFSGFQDTLIEDFAMVYPIPTLLNDYTSVPWDHYKNNPAGKMNTATNVYVRNSYLNGGANISSAAGGKIEVFYNDISEGSVNLNGQVLAGFPASGAPDYQPRTTYHSEHDVSTIPFDISKPGVQQSFEIQTSATVLVGSNFTPNDTAYSTQYFGNYYSYDDGTAENGYGPQGNQSRLAIQYTTYEADSLIGMMAHFVPTVDDVSNKLFRMTIWSDNGGVPGSVIYQDDPFFLRQPEYQGIQNKFTTYFTEDTMKIPVSGTFYIGWVQIDPDRLNIGLDRNIDNKQHTFYNTDGGSTWTVSGITGSVMIRPIFSTGLDPALGIYEKEILESELTIYPIPSNGIFNVSSSTGKNELYHVFSMMGQQILSSTENTFNLSNYPNGVYFVKSTATSKTYKIIKN